MENDQEPHDRPTQPIPIPLGEGSAPRAAPSVTARRMSEDTIATPPPLPRASSVEQSTRRAPAALWALVIVSLLISLCSLALNGVLIYRLLAVRQTVVAGLDAAIGALDGLAAQGFRYDYHIDRVIPFSGDIPFKQEMNFPFEGNIPINTTVKVPIDAGLLGTFEVNVPINTTVRIKTSVPVRVDETFHISTEVPVDLTIPIEIQPNDPAIQGLIGPVRALLLELKEPF